MSYIRGVEIMRVYVCWFGNLTTRDWDGVHIAFRSKTEAEHHINHCEEDEMCDTVTEIELV